MLLKSLIASTILAILLTVGLLIQNLSLSKKLDSVHLVELSNKTSNAPSKDSNPTTTVVKQDVEVPSDRIVALIGVVGDSLEQGQATLPTVSQLHALDDGKTPIYLLINSPGGSVIGGAQIVTAVQESKSPVYTICLELCASMAFIVHQYGTERYMVNRSIIMSHQAAGGFDGSFGQIKSRFQMLTNYIDKLDAPIAARAGYSLPDYRALVSNELWMDAEEATKMKFNDKIVNLILDKNATAEVDAMSLPPPPPPGQDGNHQKFNFDFTLDK